MAVKITEKALRDFVKKMLIEQQRGDDSEREPTDPPAVSNIPFDGPLAGVRVVRVEGNLICNPSYEEIENSDLNFFEN